MSRDEFEYPNHSVRVVCGTCGKETFFPPSQAKRRRYCSQECYDNRPTVSLGLAILRLLGGVDVVAEWMGLPHPATGSFQNQLTVGAGVSVAPVVADGTLYVLDNAGRLHAYR